MICCIHWLGRSQSCGGGDHWGQKTCHMDFRELKQGLNCSMIYQSNSRSINIIHLQSLRTCSHMRGLSASITGLLIISDKSCCSLDPASILGRPCDMSFIPDGPLCCK